ncbi:uncharacterized protein METZ01_LOCUS421258 [marine metagenome]|uniref:Uncharacterized protein n=1 Tax=marine metagenome TaxID=408172 RepID=A0A382XC19_9ZZZZ
MYMSGMLVLSGELWKQKKNYLKI